MEAYALPQTNFTRKVNADKTFVFRVPTNWQLQGTDLTFPGPHNSRLAVLVEKIPDGYPLQEYFGSFLRRVRDTPTAETLITRRTKIQELESRELVIDTPNDAGEIYRSTSWVTVQGAMAITFMLQAPIPHAAELEPFFKAVSSRWYLSRRDMRHSKHCELRRSSGGRLVEFTRSKASGPRRAREVCRTRPGPG